VDLYNKIYIKNGYSVPFDILSGKHRNGAYKKNGKDVFGIDFNDGVSNENANEDFKTIISNFWMLVPEMKIEFNDGILKKLINKMNLLIPEEGLTKVEDMIHFYDDIIVRNMIPGNGELYLNDKNNKKTYYSDDKLYNNMQYFIVPNTDTYSRELENIQPSFKANQNVTCNITCKFINIDILEQHNIDKYTQLFIPGTITKVFISDDFFNKEINKEILSNLLTEQNNTTPEVILLPCLHNKSSNNKIINNEYIKTTLYTEFNEDNNNCKDTNFISIVLNNFYTNTPINRIEENLGGKRRKSTKKTKKTRKPRKKSRKSRKHKKSRKH
jgi:hypothetical protein